MRQEEESRSLKDQALEDGEEVILRPGDLPPIWKPETVGETMVGELLSVKRIKFGDVLRLRTAKGIEAVPQGAAMADTNFSDLIGRRLRFVFKGAVETKAGYQVKLFQISVLRKKDDEDVPF